jgi:type VI secretion system secreted protein VgrG
MPPPTWTFSSSPLQADKCRVLAFTGDDAVCKGYVFDILLLADVQTSQVPKLMDDLVKAPKATLQGKRSDGSTFPWNGMVSEVSHITTEERGALLHVQIRPRTYRLDLSRHSRIFMNMRLPKVLTCLMDEEGFNVGSDVKASLQGSYAQRPITCQFDETSHVFMRRHLEREGAYSYIAQDGDGDVLILADEVTQPETLPLRDDLTWEKGTADEMLVSLIRTLRASPSSVTLRDYAPDKPGLVTATSKDTQNLLPPGIEMNLFGGYGLLGDVDISGRFDASAANNVAQDLSQAAVRAMTSKARQTRGRSTVPWLRAGYAVTVESERYQLLAVRHKCNLATDAMDGRLLQEAGEAGFEAGRIDTGYRNEFTCHPLSLGAYSSPRETRWPHVGGLVHAKVDAEGSGKYAELDDEGRYKVNFYFPEKVIYADKGDPGPGKRSIPLDMMQMHIGSSSGVHFPLLKGAEVLVAFTDGDPDRPVILGAHPNPDNPGVVTDKNTEDNVIVSPGGNKITLMDAEGGKGMKFETPDGTTVVQFLSTS